MLCKEETWPMVGSEYIYMRSVFQDGWVAVIGTSVAVRNPEELSNASSWSLGSVPESGFSKVQYIPF